MCSSDLLAEAAAVVWTVAAVAVLVLSYSDVAGVPVGGGSTYTEQLLHYATDISAGQGQTVIVVVAAVVTTLVFGVRALAARLEDEFGLAWQFLHHPTGL